MQICLLPIVGQASGKLSIVESILAARFMDEHVSLLTRVAESSMKVGSADVVRLHLEQAADSEHKSLLIRKMLLST